MLQTLTMNNLYTIISDNSILSWLVRSPTDQEEKNFLASKVTHK